MAPVQLQVSVEAASGLQKHRDGILTSRPSPYVVIETVGKEGLRFQSPVVRNSLSPVWNFTVDVCGFDMSDMLQFTMMDSNTWPRADKLLGKAFLTRQDVCATESKVELALTESTSNATLLVTVVVVGDTDQACEHVAVREATDLGLKEAHESAQEQLGVAMEQGGVLNTCRSTELSSSNCLVDVENNDIGDDKSSVTCMWPEDTGSTLPGDAGSMLPEGTGSTELPSHIFVGTGSHMLFPMQMFGVGYQGQLVPSAYFPPPLVFSRTVHAPVTVSAEEFARVMTGTAVVHSMEPTASATHNGPVEEPQSLATSTEALTKPATQIKLRQKRRVCC